MSVWLQTYDVSTLDQLSSFARRLAPLLRAGDALLLDGDLGAGKTTLIQALCSALGSQDVVTSPTYTIAQLYRCPVGPIVHLDAYRLRSSAELWDLGYEDEMDHGLSLIEWGQRVADDFPDALHILLEIVSEAQRRITVSANHQPWCERLNALEHT